MAKKKDNAAKKEAKQQKQENKATKKAKKAGKNIFGDDIDSLLAEFAESDRKQVGVHMDVVTEGFVPARSGSAMVAHPTRPEILFFGGEVFDGRKVTTFNDAYVYNVPKNQLTKITIPQAQGPGPRTSAASAMVELSGGSSLFLCCGDYTSPRQQFKHYSDLFVLKFPDNNNYSELKWEKITSPGAPSMRSGHRMVYYKRKLYVFGGFYDNNESVKYLDDLYVFDLDTYTWTKYDGKKATHWPKARSGFGFAVVDQFAYVYGGYTTVTKNSDETGNVLSDMWQLNLNTLEWTQLKATGDVPKNLAGASMFSVMNKVFLFGGCTDVHNSDDTIDSVFYNTFYEFNLRKKVWEKLSVHVGKDPFNKPSAAAVEQMVDTDDNKKKKKKAKEATPSVDTKSWKWGGAEEATSAPVAPVAEDSDGENDGLFAMLDDLALEDEADEEKTTVAKRTGFLFPRRNAQICVKNGLVYVFGGVLEQGDKEVTLDDLHYIDTRKMKTVLTLRDANIAGQKWEEEEDEDDDEDDDDEEEPVKGKKGGASKKKRQEEEDDDEDDEEDAEESSDPLQPKAGEDARKYFERTKDHYISEVMTNAETMLSDKEMRTAAFALANKAYKERQ